jgi:hypothetical protein
MGRLDELDLSRELSKIEEAERLAAAQQRLLEVRLVLGGLVGDRGIGPPVCVVRPGPAASWAMVNLVMSGVRRTRHSAQDGARDSMEIHAWPLDRAAHRRALPSTPCSETIRRMRRY